MVDPHAVAPDRGQDGAEPLRAFQFGREARGGGQRVQRVAGDDRVDSDPDDRRDRRQREVAGARSSVGRPPGAPQPVDPAQHPRVRAQQPGGSERQEDRPPAPRAFHLEHDRPQDQRHVGDVEVALGGEVLDEEAAQQQQRRHDARRPGRSTGAQGDTCRRRRPRRRRSSRAPSASRRPGRRSSRASRRRSPTGARWERGRR